ncbi:MAG: hypothetical protein ACP5IO_02050 [Elusimicrobiales bacterium]
MEKIRNDNDFEGLVKEITIRKKEIIAIKILSNDIRRLIRYLTKKIERNEKISVINKYIFRSGNLYNLRNMSI